MSSENWNVSEREKMTNSEIVSKCLENINKISKYIGEILLCGERFIFPNKWGISLCGQDVNSYSQKWDGRNEVLWPGHISPNRGLFQGINYNINSSELKASLLVKSINKQLITTNIYTLIVSIFSFHITGIL